MILFNFPLGIRKYEKLGALLFDLSALTAHTDKQYVNIKNRKPIGSNLEHKKTWPKLNTKVVTEINIHNLSEELLENKKEKMIHFFCF